MLDFLHYSQDCQVLPVSTNCIKQSEHVTNELTKWLQIGSRLPGIKVWADLLGGVKHTLQTYGLAQLDPYCVKKTAEGAVRLGLELGQGQSEHRRPAPALAAAFDGSHKGPGDKLLRA